MTWYVCQGPCQLPVVDSKVGRDPAEVEAVALFDHGENLCLEVLEDHRCRDQRVGLRSHRPASRCALIKPVQRSWNTIKQCSLDGRPLTGGKGGERQRPDPGAKFSRADPPTAEEPRWQNLAWEQRFCWASPLDSSWFHLDVARDTCTNVFTLPPLVFC